MRPVPAGVRRLLPSVIIGFSPVDVPHGLTREPCGKVPWSNPGMASGSTRVAATATAPVRTALRPWPGLRAESAGVRASGTYRWLHARIIRYPATVAANPQKPTLWGLIIAG